MNKNEALPWMAVKVRLVCFEKNFVPNFGLKKLKHAHHHSPTCFEARF